MAYNPMSYRYISHYITLVGGENKHCLFSISYMGCHPSHWRTPSFFTMVVSTPSQYYSYKKCPQFQSQNQWSINIVGEEWMIIEHHRTILCIDDMIFHDVFHVLSLFRHGFLPAASAEASKSWTGAPGIWTGHGHSRFVTVILWDFAVI